MKKYLVYSLFGAAALSMASCDEDFNDVAAPQEWAQEEAITLPTISANAVGSIDLATAGDSITVFTVSGGEAPSGTQLTNFRLTTDFQAEIKAGDNGKVATADLQALIENQFGKRPTERTFNSAVYANIMKDGQASLVELGNIEVKATPKAPDYPEFIYEIGNNTGWGNAYALYSPDYDGIYHGAMFLKSGFKFRSNANDWNGEGNWGLDADGKEGKLISDGASKDIPLTEDGFYKITVDLNKMEYTLAKFEKLGIIGDGQAGGWDTDTELTYDDTEKCWKATGVELTGGKSIKFRTVGDWNTVNIGGASLDKLIFNSNDNIPVAESGTFTVKLFLETAGQPYATLTKE